MKVIFPKPWDQVAKMKRMEKRIPANIDWDDIDSIATEARQKFKPYQSRNHRPSRSRISGVNPADISILMVYLEGKIVVFLKTQEKEKIEKTAPKTGRFVDLFIWCEDHRDDDRFTLCIFRGRGEWR